MKRKLHLMLITTLLALAGCVTPPPADRLARITALCAIAAKDGTILTLQTNPQYRPAFELVYAELNSLVTSGHIIPAELTEILKELPVKDLKGQGAQIIIGDLPFLVDALLGSNVDLQKVPYTLAAATGIRDGLKVALGK